MYAEKTAKKLNIAWTTILDYALQKLANPDLPVDNPSSNHLHFKCLKPPRDTEGSGGPLLLFNVHISNILCIFFVANDMTKHSFPQTDVHIISAATFEDMLCKACAFMFKHL